MKNAVLFLWACLVLGTSSYGQRYTFKNYTTHDGLVQTDITDIQQDRRGNIWIGTNGGISVFDGKSFTNYDDHDLLKSLRINALLCDSSGIMWIATRNGLLRFCKNFEVFFQARGSRTSVVSSMGLNAQNQLYFVCNGSVYRVSNDRAEAVAIDKRLDRNAAMLAFDRDDNLWIVTNDARIFRKSPGGLLEIKTPLGQQQFRAGFAFIRVLGKEGPEPYFVSNFGTFCVQDDSLRHFSQQYRGYERAKIGAATYIAQEGDSTFWVGGVTGLAKLQGGTVRRYTAENGFCDNSVSCLFVDREHNLWVGCTYNGVYKLGNEALLYLKPRDESFDLRHVSAIAPLSGGTALLATWGRGLYHFAADTVTRLPLPPYIRYITSLLTVNDATYIGWFGKGLWKMDHRSGGLSPVRGFAADEAVGMLLRMDDKLVVQMLDNRCYLTDLNFGIKATTVLAEDQYLTVVRNRLYRVSVSGQVDVLNEQLQPLQTNLFPEVSSRITQIVSYRDYFLVGTFGQGLFLYDAWGKLRHRLDKSNGLPTNIVTSVLVDGDEAYLGSNLGLVRVRLPDFRAIRVFREGEGMFNWECRTGGLQKLSNGALIVATTNGPYLYRPFVDQQQASGVLTVARITAGAKAEKDLVFDPRPQINLASPIDYRDNTVTVGLSGVSQRNPEGILYHYQLLGYDSMWVTTPDPVLTFENLDPGAYKLRAYLSVADFRSAPVIVSFAIAKPLSGQLWFQVLLVLLLSGVCWMLLTAGNRIYQKYIQARMLGNLRRDVARKQQLTAGSLSFAERQYRELGEVLRNRSVPERLETLTPGFLREVGQRIGLLWQQESVSLAEMHRHLEGLLHDHGHGAKLYKRIADDSSELPAPVAFRLLQLFALYLYVGLYECDTAVYSLDADGKSNGLLLRLYNMTHERGSPCPASYHLLKEAIRNHDLPELTVDVVENLEYGNMIVAELNLKNEIL